VLYTSRRGQTLANRQKYADAVTRARGDRLGLWEDAKPKAPWVLRGETSVPEIVTVLTAPQQDEGVNASSSTVNADRQYKLGPRGGCFYIAPSGRKTYVDRSKCG
ncbi:MAG: hypothetical protein LC734_04960, partial [Acidobacteria bacterium]|nr:hypothetical protein [Acidobacteriota bacterium]